MAKKVFVNRAKMSTATVGTGDIVLDSAVAGFQTFEEAGIVDGNEVRYVIEDGDNWEVGYGTYTAATTTLSRVVEESSNADALISLSGSAFVFIALASNDFVQIDGDVMTGNLGFEDNVKIQVGTNNDLEIVHDGTNTTINERGTGNLKFQVGGIDVATVTSSGISTNITGNVTGNVTGDVTGNVTGNVSGNAGTATALQTARTIGLSGDVSGSVSFDGTADVTITATVADDSHDHSNATISADGFMAAADKLKLDGIEAGATADQTAAEIKTAYESNADTNAFTDAEQSKLSGIEVGATADQTGAEIKTLYEAELDTNAFTDAEKSKLSGIEAGATADQTASEILTAVKTVDGSGSGLDADLLDGQEGAYYQPASTALTTSTTFGGDVSGTYNAIVVADDSHNHIIGNVDGLQTALDSKLSLSGGTMTGNLILNADPTTALGAATKEYVDTIAAAGIHYHAPVRVEAPSNLNATYDNGSSGVGATLTNAGTNEAIVIDGVALSLADRVLIYQQTNAAHNGIYTVTTVGDGTTPWVLTRATDADSYGVSDPDAFGEGDAFFVKEGDTGAGELYVMNTSGPITFGTTAITFTVIAETAVYTAGTGMTLTGTVFSIGQEVETISTPTFAGLTINGNIAVTGTVDGRDVAADGTKLDGIEAGATADQTAAEIKTAYESNANTNAFTDAFVSKLNGIEAGADVTDATNVAAAGAAMVANNLSDLTNAATARTNLGLAIGTNVQAYDAQLADIAALSPTDSAFIVGNGTNFVSESGATARASLGLTIGTHVQAYSSVLQNTTASFTTALETKLNGIEAGATGDQTAAEIRALVEAATDSNVFTDADHTKLNGIASGAEVNQNAFSNVAVSGQSTVAADGKTDTLNLAAGSNVTITTDAATDTITIAATDTNTTYAAGGGLTLSGTTFSHTDTSAQGSVNNSGATVIQDVTLDTYGHVTGLGSTTLTAAAVGAAAASHTHTSSQITDLEEFVEDQIGANIVAGSNVSVSYNDTTGQTTISSTDTNTTYSAGSGLSLSGTTFSHADTSAQASVNNSGRTYIQDITLDTYGHIIGISSATETVVNTDTNNYVTSATFNTADGILTLNRTGLSAVTVDLDGRYSTTDTNTTYSAGAGLDLNGTVFSIESDLRGEAWLIGRDTNDYIAVNTTTIDFVLDGNVDARIENDGDFHADGNVIAYSTTISDPRLKENIEPITDALEKISMLNGYTFTYKADGVTSAGVMSTEVAKVLPSAIKKSKLKLKMGEDNETEYDIVQYDQLHGLLIEAIKEQQAQIEALKEDIAALKGK